MDNIAFPLQLFLFEIVGNWRKKNKLLDGSSLNEIFLQIINLWFVGDKTKKYDDY